MYDDFKDISLAKLTPTGKLVGILGPAVAKYFAVESGVIGGADAGLVKNSIVLDLAVAYGNYLLPKVEEGVIAGFRNVTLPGAEYAKAGSVSKQLGVLQSQIDALDAPMPKAEVVSPAIATIGAQKTAQLIG